MHDIDFQLQHMLRGEFSLGRAISDRLEKLGPGRLPSAGENSQEDLWLRHCFNRGWFMLQDGDYQKGCQLLESGRHLKVYGSAPLQTSAPIYNPAVHEIKGKSIIISLEGGYGDEIIHARWATSFKRLGAKRVYLAAAPEIQSIFKQIEGVDGVILRNEAHLVQHDYWAPGFSCGWLTGHDYNSIPGEPYLKARPESVEIWKHIVKSSRPKVGIRWAGSPKFEHQQFRRFPNNFMLQLSKYDVQLYSFQRDDNLEVLPSGVVDLQHLLASWDDTLAALVNLDLLITSCTSVAHAAAALGVPTWIVVPIMPYHTWALGAPHTTTSPFYKSVTLYRQDSPDRWNSAFQRVYRDLETRFGLERLTLPDHDKSGTVFNISEEFKMASNYSDYLADALYRLKKYKEAVAQNQITLSFIGGNHPRVHRQLAQCYYELGDLQSALSSLSYVDLTPQDRRMQAHCLSRLSRFEEALEIVQGLESSPERLLDLGWFAHKAGRFKEAMRLTELGRGSSAWIGDKTIPNCPRWTGQPLDGKTLVVIGEAGMGDEIIFSRWLPLLQTRCRVIYQTDNSLGEVFCRQFKVSKQGVPDYWVPSMSLPALLSADSPGDQPYLTARPDLVNTWKRKLPDRFTAVSWTGEPTHGENQWRRIDPEILKRYPGILVNVNPGAKDVPDWILNTDISSWEDTLAILSLSERVLTVSSSVSVAAGALGVETHVLTNPVDYFTWCGTTSGELSSWFPNVRVWRQLKLGQWSHPVDALFKYLMVDH